MSFNNQDTENNSMKCPNPECGLVLQSPYHTVCPLCAEPFPVSMLHQEEQKKQVGKLVVLIVLLLAFIALVIMFISMSE